MLWNVFEASKLRELFPIFTDTNVRVGCPLQGAGICAAVGKIYDLPSMIGHLNDVHLCPRTETDRNQYNQHLPTISGWLKEEAEKNGWDLTVRREA